jgi:hypothetical protein
VNEDFKILDLKEQIALNEKKAGETGLKNALTI